MAGSHFDTAIHTEVEGGEIDFFGTRQADIQHVHARITQAFRQRHLQRLAGQTHIAAEHDGFRFQELTVCAANPPRNLFVQLFAQLAANIVGFKTG
ncbi:hypothetical protein D3C81_2104390 [compost metagenome]